MAAGALPADALRQASRAGLSGEEVAPAFGSDKPRLSEANCPDHPRFFVLPTAAEKIICFACITSNTAVKSKRVIMVAHRQEIVDLIAAALGAIGVTHGRIQAGHRGSH
jgi:hypothetical protein